eukprot:3533401-Alexandrium_andersonii.AAC.1
MLEGPLCTGTADNAQRCQRASRAREARGVRNGARLASRGGEAVRLVDDLALVHVAVDGYTFGRCVWPQDGDSCQFVLSNFVQRDVLAYVVCCWQGRTHPLMHGIKVHVRSHAA